MEPNLRSRHLDLGKYDTDKVKNRYLEIYDAVIGGMWQQDLKLLELGIFKGGSLLLWRDYFPNATVAGVDIEVPEYLHDQERVHVCKGWQHDTALLSDFAAKIAPDGFDIILDDASHIGQATRTSFWHLFENHLKPGSLYVIEDWGTGYWEDWPDGKAYRKPSWFMQKWRKLLARFKDRAKMAWHNHNYGLVGFIKELVDEQGYHDLSMKKLTGKAERLPKFENLLIYPSIVFVRKRNESTALAKAA